MITTEIMMMRMVNTVIMKMIMMTTEIMIMRRKMMITSEIGGRY